MKQYEFIHHVKSPGDMFGRCHEMRRVEKGTFCLVDEVRKDVAAKAHAIAEKMCGCDPTYCLCDGLHSKEEIEKEIIRQFS
jgi:hypothetical protein